jgi:group I intron endonuclease
MIYKALLKYSHSNFQLDILEYCGPSDLIKIEQYYLDLIKPEYNILNFAGSSVGFKHTEASIELIRQANSNRKPVKHTEATIEIIRLANLGRVHTEASKLKMVAAKAQPVIVINNPTGISTEFPSMKEAAKSLDVTLSYV